MTATPIFILSVPRSGSTLLQRLLNTHVDISTQPEPWIALPVFYALRKDGVNAVYGHKALSIAVSGFVESMPEGVNDYYSCASMFLQDLYTRVSNNESLYFIDKTPRYHLIVNELLASFPEAKFIFLWRNPLAISASMIQTWGKGEWNLYMFLVDLYSGIESLTEAFKNSKERVISVRYEDLVSSADQEMTRIMSYLDLDYDIDMQAAFTDKNRVDAPGRGDPVGQSKYKNVSQSSLDSWKSVMSNPFRKAWSKNYLKWIGKKRLEEMGYDIDELHQTIDSQSTNIEYLLSDIARYTYGKLYCKFQLECIRNNEPWNSDFYFTKN